MTAANCFDCIMTRMLCGHPAPDARVLIVDDHKLFAHGLAMLVQRDLELDTEVLGSCEEALARLERGERYGLVVLDLELPGMSGLQGLHRLRAMEPTMRVVVCSSNTSALAVQSAMDGGAQAYIHKSETPDQMCATLRRVLKGVAAEPRPIGTGSGLTTRQQEVLLLLVEGKSNKVIARALGMSENTVRNHVAAILERLGAANRHEAANAAVRLGLMHRTNSGSG